MIRLKPNVETIKQNCPSCGSELAADGYLIPGMRNLADLRCPGCSAEYFGDLPSGQGLFTPYLIEKGSGNVSGNFNADWFSDWLARSYRDRTTATPGFRVKQFLDIKKSVILLNCLDTLYGHSLLKLLNAQYYLDNKTDHSLIVIVPTILEWMVPDGVAEAWIVDLPLRSGTQWNDGLADEIGERLDMYDEVYLSTAFSHPHFEDFDIERFTRVKPFQLDKLGEFTPVISFIWREDRLWEPKNSELNKLKTFLGSGDIGLTGQITKITRFAEELRHRFPEVDFAVIGLGQTGDFPGWIKDLRSSAPDPDMERQWCERYADSHLVIGVHGSNMLLPSAHASSVIEIIGTEREGNFLQDILLRCTDARDALFRYRFVPHSTSAETLVMMTVNILRYDDHRRLMAQEYCRHKENYNLEDFIMIKEGKDHQSEHNVRN